jgi:hypothetical protein
LRTFRIAAMFFTSEIGLRLKSSRPDHIANSTSPCISDRTCVLDIGDNMSTLSINRLELNKLYLVRRLIAQ